MALIKNISSKIRTIISDETKSFARTPRKFALKDWKSFLPLRFFRRLLSLSRFLALYFPNRN